jgi:hypothetical protein
VLIIFMRSRKYTWTKVLYCLITAKWFDGGKFGPSASLSVTEKGASSAAYPTHAKKRLEWDTIALDLLFYSMDSG